MPPSASLPAKREVRCCEDEIKSFQAELRLFLSSQGNSWCQDALDHRLPLLQPLPCPHQQAQTVLKSTPPGRKASLSSGGTALVYGRHIILIPSQQLGHTGAWNATLQQ